MFIEKSSTPLEFRRNDIATADALRKHIVPTGLRVGMARAYYKHIVPTKSTPNARMAFGGTEEQNAHSKNPKIDT